MTTQNENNMKKTFLMMMLCIMAIPAGAQIIVNFDNLNQYRTLKVSLTVKDENTSDPISFASAYLIPQGDTTITNFALSDEKGDIVFDEVLSGKYEVNIEMIGYFPYKKVHELKGYRQDLGIIKLQENPEFIDASTITAVGNPITVKKDTIEYNASSFHVGENAVLEDLLKKMPGMEVGEDGSVSVNGEQVDKITVGGKTFFFDDPSMAVKNLPAKIVDKIKVIDKDNEEAEISGMKSHDSKEKVMDVELREEYKKGWFGNLKAGGGYTLTPKTGDELTDHKGLLYNVNGLMSAYGEKDQVVVIANGQNATDPSANGGQIYLFSDDLNEFDMKQGLSTNATAGVNYNTDRIRNLPTTISVSYKYNHKDAKEKTARTSFVTEGDDLFTEGFFDGSGDGHSVTTSLEMKNAKTDRFYFSFKPKVTYSTKSDAFANRSMTTIQSDTLNRSYSEKFNNGTSIDASGQLNLGFKDMGGKTGRNISLFTYASFRNNDGTSGENTKTFIGDSLSVMSLLYDKNSSESILNVNVSYVEPLSDTWMLNVNAGGNYYSSKSDKIASDGIDGTYNDYYSNITDNENTSLSGGLGAQYENGSHILAFGLDANVIETANYVRNLGIETTTGKGEWMLRFNPTLDYMYEGDSFNTGLYYFGHTSNPSGSRKNPTPDLTDPSMISVGNIYLKPTMAHYLGWNLRHNNRENFSFVNVNVNGQMQQNGIVQASWFDRNAIRYSVPVNSRKPSYSFGATLTYNQPFGKKKHWTFSTYIDASYRSDKGYQAVSQLAGMNIAEFDYTEFMSGFWGNPEGDRFYSGESGFSESRMNTLHYALDLGMKYQIDRFNAAVHAFGRNQISRYSLDPQANANTWLHSYSIEATYTTPDNWEFSSKCNANFYIGYSAGFGAPQFNWNASISKTIKSVTLALRGIDLLNQSSRNLTRNATSEYVMDTYRNVLGRYFLLSVSFNFGKMNAKKSQAVQNATWNLAF